MRINMMLSVAVAALLLTGSGLAAEPAPTQAPTQAFDSRYTAVLGLDAAIVGLSFGPRAELLYRLGPKGTWSHLRTTAGVLFGPEFVFVPVGVGYRAMFRQDKTVQPFVGVAYESHFFLAGADHVFVQWGVFCMEAGAGFAVSDRVALGAAAQLEFSFIGEPGPGLEPRLFGAFKF